MATQVFGLIGEIRAEDDPSFLYNLITPDFSQQPKRPNNPFSGDNNYPSATALFHQRRVFVSTLNRPSSIFFSGVAAYSDYSIQTTSESPFELELDSEYYDPINHIVAAQFGILLFSERGIYLVISREGGGISVGSATSKSELGSGSKRDIQPLRILNNIVYLSNLDNSPRALTPVETSPNQFATQDLALYSQHFFGTHKSFIEEEALASSFNPSHRSGAEITSWTYAGRPNRSIWATRADGLLLNCTFAPEHDINAWSKHATKGRFQAAQSVYEKNSDTVYLVVERGEHKFIEALSKEDASRLDQSIPVDAAVRTINKEPAVATKLLIYDYISGNRQGTETDEDTENVSDFSGYSGLGATLEGSGYAFSNSDEGAHIRTSGGLYRIDDRRSNTSVEISIIHEVESDDASYFVHNTNHRHPVYRWELVDQRTVYNAFHLQDQTIMTVEGDDTEDNREVGSNGRLSTRQNNDRGIVVGLPFKSSVKTLPLVVADIPIENKLKRLYSAGLRVRVSSSMSAGVSGSALYPVIIGTDGDPKKQFSTGVFNIDVSGDWSLDDSVEIESQLPFVLLGMVLNFDYGNADDERSRLRGALDITV